MLKTNFEKKILTVAFWMIPLLQFAQDDGENPDPFDDTPPDFVPPAPIDSYLIPMFIIGVIIALYFFCYKKKYSISPND